MEYPKDDLRRFLSRAALGSFRMIACVCAFVLLAHAQTSPRAHVAVLDFGDSPAGKRASEKVRQTLLDQPSAANGIILIDRNLAMAAALGIGFQGSLNLTNTEARDIGAAIGCDFFILGEGDTVRRSPSTGAAYYESYASIFIVSARTGRLISWERPLERRDTADEAEKALLQIIGDAHHYQVLILHALADESAERASAVETPPTSIEVMSDDKYSSDARTPRPYRRLKPPYPDSAAVAEVEATVDVLVDIDAHGEIGHLEIARWAGYGLDQSVIDTVKQMHFFPAMRDGVAIPMRVLLRYNFRKPAK